MPTPSCMDTVISRRDTNYSTKNIKLGKLILINKEQKLVNNTDLHHVESQNHEICWCSAGGG